MNIVDLLVTIVVVTILVTIVLAVVTYVAYKLRLSREPGGAATDVEPQYFVRFDPAGTARGSVEHGPTGVDGDEHGRSEHGSTKGARALSAAEGHAAEA